MALIGNYHDLDNTKTTTTSSSLSPITLCWKNLCYNVYEWQRSGKNNLCDFPKRQPKSILNHLNGHVRLNSLNALLGPSGAGKTSLINCLTGNIPVNGKLSDDTEIYLKKYARKSLNNNEKIPLFGIVPQFVQEIIFSHFTVEEILYYAFCFKNPYHQYKHVDDCIRSTMDELMLDQRIRTTSFEKCSGGEKRRIAIAQELMSNVDSRPIFLFIDEPTTGLDSESASLVIQCLQRLSKQNPITVFVSIHSPSHAILNHFDKIFILAKDGLCIYSGRPNILRLYLKQVTKIELNDEISPIEKYLAIASNGIEDVHVKQLADNVIHDQQNHLMNMASDPNQNLNNYESIPNGLPHYRKSFNFVDLSTQLQRLFRLIFIVDIRILMGIILLQTISITTFTSIVDKNILDLNGCVSNEWSMKNNTCDEHLNEERLTSVYFILQTVYIIGIIGISAGLLAILSIEYLKVVRNEYLNGMMV
ncbi:hypothetical protein BLA29_002658 [Euroglyphus maynei]|uniref:ABC transporter domain-containing protein n=1 Tax=Euroglyphus maynei TaxID=6958 RepID=A0A1Y3ANR7_EURMA|nr:hypothetical protein BLA29_002658 [Euroglyphus maynei]